MNSYTFADIVIGQSEKFNVKITSDMMEKFKDITKDINPLHSDKTFVSEHFNKDKIVCYGMLTASFLSTLAGVYLPGKYSLILSTNISFSQPVYVNDRLTICGEVIDKNDLFKTIEINVNIINDDEQYNILIGSMLIKLLK